MSVLRLIRSWVGSGQVGELWRRVQLPPERFGLSHLDPITDLAAAALFFVVAHDGGRPLRLRPG